MSSDATNNSATVSPVSTQPKNSSKKKAVGAKKLKAGSNSSKPNHPKTSDMVMKAVKELKHRKGSSLQAIKKYIAAHYKVDADKIAVFIRRALIKAVSDGRLLQTKGTGANGSFKLPSTTTKSQPKLARNNTITSKKPGPNGKSKQHSKAKRTSTNTSAKRKTKSVKPTSKKNAKKSPKPKKAPSKPKAKKAVSSSKK